MYKKRFLLFIPLLIIVTLCVSMGPNVINSYIKKDLLESKEYWTYNEPEDVEVTDTELAKFFVGNGFGEGSLYSNSYNDADLLELETINEQTKNVLYTVFGEDEIALKKIEYILDSELVSYDRQILLTVIGGRTMSFVFVYLTYMDGIEQIDIVYEEKTSAVMSFDYQMWEPEKVDWRLIDSILRCTEAYSENVLGLNKGQYTTMVREADYEVNVSFTVEQTVESEKQVDEISETWTYEYEG